MVAVAGALRQADDVEAAAEGMTLETTVVAGDEDPHHELLPCPSSPPMEL